MISFCLIYLMNTNNENKLHTPQQQHVAHVAHADDDLMSQ